MLRRLPLSTLVLLSTPAGALAVDEFPRGPGFYFNLPKLVLVLLVYLAWVATCRWVSQDSKTQEIETFTTWNAVMAGCGFLGLALFWALPWFFPPSPRCRRLSLRPRLCTSAARTNPWRAAGRVLRDGHRKRR